ncbi:MAG: hypothetical protein PHV60_00945 [bacterium]|nr:hypothetical protein [bacterium]
MKILKIILRSIGICLLAVFLIAVSWYNWPQKQEDKFKHLPANALVYGQINIDWHQPGPKQLFDVFWKKIAAINPPLNNSLAKKIVLSMLPRDIVFSLNYDREHVRSNKEPDYRIVINYGKKTRLIKLVMKIASYQGLDRGENRWFSINNNLVVLSPPEISKDVLLISESTEMKTIFKPYAREELNIYITNKKKELSELIKFLEERNSFAFFTSIDSVDYVQLDGVLAGASQVKGKISFTAKYIADVDKIGLDAFFLNNLFMRLLIGYGLTYEGEVTTLANFVEINYQVKGLENIWRQIQ